MKFFTDKGANITSSIRAKFTGSTVDPYTYDQLHNGPTLDDLPIVTAEEVARILTFNYRFNSNVNVGLNLTANILELVKFLAK